MIKEEFDILDEIEVPANPFPGLRPFEYRERFLFFGRSDQSQQLIAKLSQTRFLAVIGTSGSGKSSLVRAGLLPALYGGFMQGAGSAWRVAIMRPGNDPIGNLARALNDTEVFGSDDAENNALQVAITEATLRRGSLGLIEAVRQANMPATENLLVVADQFEEIFRVEQGRRDEEYENDKAAFVKLLLGAQSQPAAPPDATSSAQPSIQNDVRVYVALTMRSDYLGDCAQFWDLPEAINEGQYLIPRLTREQRRAAITGPIAVAGGEITPRLVNRLLNDVGDNPDQLPILQHALMRTWDEWTIKTPAHEAIHEGEAIDLCCYEAIGGMAEALSRHADEAYTEVGAKLGARGQLIAEKMFKALTEKGADNRETRRPIKLGQICAITEASEDDVIAIIDQFRAPGRSFLTPAAGAPITTDQPPIDISHESLIRGWKGRENEKGEKEKRLNEWVEEEARSARIYVRLADTAVLHREGAAGLWRDPDLKLALDWKEKNNPNRHWARRYHPEFDLAMAFLQASRRRKLLGLILMNVLVLLAAGFVFTSYRSIRVERDNAKTQKSQAEQAKQDAEKQRQLADTAKQEAIDEKTKAETEKKRAEENQKKAEEQTLIAQQQTLVASEAERKQQLEAAIATYNTRMKIVQSDFEDSNYERGNNLLNEYLSEGKKRDLRNFYWYYLWRQGHDEHRTLLGHTRDVGSVAYSPNGQVLASGGYDGTVRLWEASTGKHLYTLEGDEKQINALAFSPDGHLLAGGGGGGAVILWDARARQRLNVLAGHQGNVWAVAFSPDGRLLATGGTDKKVRLWDVKAKRLLDAFGSHQGDIGALTFSPDGSVLASGGWDKVVKLWDVASRQELGQLNHTAGVNAVAFSPDARILASGSFDSTVRLWDVKGRQELATLKGHFGMINGVAFSPNGQMLASASGDETIKLWDLKSKREMTTLKGHGDMVWSVAFSRDGKTLASGSVDKTVRLWGTTTEQEHSVIKGHTAGINTIAVSPDGRVLASGGDDGAVKLWDIQSGRPRDFLKRNFLGVTAIAYSPDRQVLAGCGEYGKVELWDVSTGRSIYTLVEKPEGDGLQNAPRRGGLQMAAPANILALAFSLDGRLLASGGRGGTVVLWDMRTRQRLDTLTGDEDTVRAITFSPNGRLLATGSADKKVWLWDVKAKRVINTFDRHEDTVNAVAFSPDGNLLASGSGSDREGNKNRSNDSTVRVWDVHNNQEKTMLIGHKARVTSVAFSLDGRILASGSADGTVKLWDVRTWQELATLKGHEADVTSVAFTPDGRTLVSGSADKTIRLWRGATDEEVARQQNK